MLILILLLLILIPILTLTLILMYYYCYSNASIATSRNHKQEPPLVIPLPGDEEPLPAASFLSPPSVNTINT